MSSRSARDVKRDVKARAADLRERVARVADDATTVTKQVPGRVERARSTVRDGIEQAEPYVRRTGIGLLGAAQAVIAVGIAIPRLVSRSLTIARILTERAETAADRGHRMAERARELAHSVEPSRRERRARQLRATLLVSAAFALGFVIGWIVADAKGLAAQEQAREATDLHAREVARRDAEETEARSGQPRRPRSVADGRVTVIEGGSPGT